MHGSAWGFVMNSTSDAPVDGGIACVAPRDSRREAKEKERAGLGSGHRPRAAINHGGQQVNGP